MLNNKEPFNIKDCYVTATFKKSDKNVVVSEGNIIDEANGLVDVPILLQVVAYPGKAHCTIEVYNKDKLRLTSIMFEFTVVEELGNNEDITSVTEYTILQTLITDVQGIKVVEEQRVINENTREQNEVDRQTIFNGIVDTANTTKDGLDASVVNANNVKSVLDDSTSIANTSKTNLDNSVSSANTINDTLSNTTTGTIKKATDINSTLGTTINSANTSKSDLDVSITQSATSKTNLDSSITNANTTKTNLDNSISTADTTKVKLDTSVTNADDVNDILSDVATGTIKQATDINTTLNSSIDNAGTSKANLDGSISDANTSKTNLDTSISISNTAKTNLDNSISTANTTKTALDGSITEGTTLKGDLDAIISGTDYEQIITNVKTIEDNLVAHQAEKASQNKLGHVKVDEKTIFINEDGEISVNNPYPHDLSGSPGSKFLIAGTMEEGFFGEVPASELITGDALASECGIAQGTSQFSTEPWLKFAYKGEIQFVAKKPIRSSISWDAINTADCVYGDSGDKTTEIGGLTYKVRLLRALEPLNDPKTVASANSGIVNHGSEWNRLMCQIHEQAISKSWDFSDNIESDIGILEHNLGNGNQGMYNDADLVVKSGDGRYSWCQEMGISTSIHLHRGRYGVSFSGNNTSSTTHSNSGWRPVLELVS